MVWSSFNGRGVACGSRARLQEWQRGSQSRLRKIVEAQVSARNHQLSKLNASAKKIAAQIDTDLYCALPAPLANLRASSAARNSALALLTHSSCSLSGSESATMPAPAWTYILPSLMRAVRSTMQLSMSPAAEK